MIAGIEGNRVVAASAGATVIEQTEVLVVLGGQHTGDILCGHGSLYFGPEVLLGLVERRRVQHTS